MSIEIFFQIVEYMGKDKKRTREVSSSEHQIDQKAGDYRELNPDEYEILNWMGETRD